MITELQNALACASRLFELLDAEEITPDAPDAVAPDKVNGDVAFEHLYFSYVPEKKLIADVNFTAKAGQRIAIVGPTGCGKTTLINLLMRFYDPPRAKSRWTATPPWISAVTPSAVKSAWSCRKPG